MAMRNEQRTEDERRTEEIKKGKRSSAELRETASPYLSGCVHFEPTAACESASSRSASECELRGSSGERVLWKRTKSDE